MSEKEMTPAQRHAWDEFWTARTQLLKAALACVIEEFTEDDPTAGKEASAKRSNALDDALSEAAMTFGQCDLKVMMANFSAAKESDTS